MPFFDNQVLCIYFPYLFGSAGNNPQAKPYKLSLAFFFPDNSWLDTARIQVLILDHPDTNRPIRTQILISLRTNPFPAAPRLVVRTCGNAIELLILSRQYLK